MLRDRASVGKDLQGELSKLAIGPRGRISALIVELVGVIEGAKPTKKQEFPLHYLTLDYFSDCIKLPF